MDQAYQLKQLVEKDLPEHAFPDLLGLYHLNPEKYPFFLESSVSYEKSPATQQSRYDILFMQPAYWLKLNKHFHISTSANLSIKHKQVFLEAFDELWRREQPLKAKKVSLYQRKENSEQNVSLPFTGGWFVFFSYELAQQVEPTLDLPRQTGELPLAYAARIKTAIIHDHESDYYYLIAEPDVDIDACYQHLLQDLQSVRKHAIKYSEIKTTITSLLEDTGRDFIASAAKVKQYIRDGDVFQVNLSRQWQANLEPSVSDDVHCHAAASLYRSLRKFNPAPFSGLISFLNQRHRVSIISSSPERLLSVRNNFIESRPIAGTKPRSHSAERDQLLLNELHAHPKEQAEHVMLIDLIRNDLGRVCEPGTVKVDEFMVNESYAHVHHIVSNVIGRKQSDKTPAQVIKAIFPGGTITGCPKVRCMEIIAELEQVARGAYTGSMGYINLDGSMDLNILIRTMTLEAKLPASQGAIKTVKACSPVKTNKTQMDDATQYLSFRAGAGLVADSIADNELHETRAKAKGLIKAIEPFLRNTGMS